MIEMDHRRQGWLWRHGHGDVPVRPIHKTSNGHAIEHHGLRMNPEKQRIEREAHQSGLAIVRWAMTVVVG